LHARATTPTIRAQLIAVPVPVPAGLLRPTAATAPAAWLALGAGLDPTVRRDLRPTGAGL